MGCRFRSERIWSLLIRPKLRAQFWLAAYFTSPRLTASATPTQLMGNGGQVFRFIRPRPFSRVCE